MCLMLGLFTMPAAAGAALMLAMFYFAAPPWPGLPEAPGMSHFLFVNFNLIELIAVLAVAASGTAQWAGLDRLAVRIGGSVTSERRVVAAAR
jgi:uncharacterized membrane protein YphA (DoxX/SURF4 family)